MSRYSAAVLADSPALFWALDATNGATDLSGNSRNGTAAGGVTIGGYSGSPLVDGTTATDFDGTDDRITSTYAPFTAGAVGTFCGWAYRDANSTADTVWSGTGNFPPAMALPASGQNTTIDLSVSQGSAALTWTSAWPGNTQWVHWAMVIDEGADSAELFINGVSQTVKTGLDPYDATAGNFNLGALSAGFNPFDGKMAGVAAFTRALSAGTLRGYYELGSNPPVLRSACHRVPSAPLVGAYS